MTGRSNSNYNNCDTPSDLPPSYEAATTFNNVCSTTSSSTTTSASTSHNSYQYQVNNNNNNNNKKNNVPAKPSRPPPSMRPQQQQQHDQQSTPYQQSTPMWSSRPPEPKPYKDNGLPWDYPPRYFCDKCRNTGYKIKNGQKTEKSCKDCWGKFARNSNVHFNKPTAASYNNYQPQPLFNIPFTNLHVNDNFTTTTGPPPQQPQFMNYGMSGPPPMGQPMMMMAGQLPPPPPPQQFNMPPRVVRPGDPSIGGVLCGRCRGAGRVYGIFDDSLWYVYHDMFFSDFRRVYLLTN